MKNTNNISTCCNDNCCDECIYVTTVNVSCYRTTLPVGESCFVRATPKPDNATNQKVTWSSSDNAIATVNPDSGLVTAQSVGTVVITATAVDRSIVSGTYVIEIVPYVFVQSLTVLNPELTMHPDERDRVNILMTPSNATNFSVKWCSSNECVATVDGLGVVKTHNVGEAIITVRTTDGSNLCATCRVIVEPVPVEAVTIESTSENMNVGDEKEIVATICPENATNKTIKWHSTNENVVTVGTYTGKVTAHKAGTAEIVATTVDGNFVASCKIWVKGKTPVILIHGRGDNSQTAWGIINGITVGTNNHFDSSINAKNTNSKNYTLVCSQEITDILPINEEDVDSPYNLGDKLKQEGYKENINLFAFNYPNEDAVVHSAEKLKKYIENLVDDIRTSGTNEEKACFYASKEDYNANNYKINLIGHSMGGLVARYYIENLGQDDKVDKLITICTPHWGSGYADVSCGTGEIAELGIHKLCDHDLRFDSKMYGGSFSTTLDCNAALGLNQCYTGDYVLTDSLQYNRPRSTKYYAIAGIDYPLGVSNHNDFTFEMPTNFTTMQHIIDYFTEKGVCSFSSTTMSIIEINPKSVGDNMVGFLSQIGWIGDNNNVNTPAPLIQMEKIFVDVDTDGGNGNQIPGLEVLNLLHNKIPHRMDVMKQILNYLN